MKNLLPLAVLAALTSNCTLKDAKDASKTKAKDIKLISKMTNVFNLSDIVDYDLDNLDRTITLAVVITNEGKINASYSVLRPGDEHDEKYAKTIAIGRARKGVKNLLPENSFISQEIGALYGNKILGVICNQLRNDINSGKIVIKGIR